MTNKGKSFRECFRSDEQFIKWIERRNRDLNLEVAQMKKRLESVRQERDAAQRETALAREALLEIGDILNNYEEK